MKRKIKANYKKITISEVEELSDPAELEVDIAPSTGEDSEKEGNAERNRRNASITVNSY